MGTTVGALSFLGGLLVSGQVGDELLVGEREHVVERLIEAANHRGGADNITVVVVVAEC